MASRFLFILLLARVSSVVLPVTYKQNKQKLSNLFCVSVVAVKTLPVPVASVLLVPFHLHNLGLHLSSQPNLPHLPHLPHLHHLPPHCHHFPHCPALHPAHPALHHHPWHLPQTVHHHQCYHCCHYHRLLLVYLRTKMILKCLNRYVSVGIYNNFSKKCLAKRLRCLGRALNSLLTYCIYH